MNYGQDIRIEKQIAQGGSGNIFVGSILNVERKKRLGELADEFVIKRADDEDDFSDDQFHQEVAIMNAFSYHGNVVALLGYTANPNCIVLPFMRQFVSLDPF